jgi:septal ring factor EnvC (AmiA/AmiB activator)
MPDPSTAFQLGEAAAGLVVGVGGAVVVLGRILRERLGKPPAGASLSSLIGRAVALGEANAKHLKTMEEDIATLRDDVRDIRDRLDGEAENVRQMRREVESERDARRETDRRVHELEVHRVAQEARAAALGSRVGHVEGQLLAMKCQSPADGQAACDAPGSRP